MRSALVLVLAACAGAQPRPVALPPIAEVRVAAATCLAPGETEAAVRRVLAEHHAEHSSLVVNIAVRPATGGSDVGVTITRPNGDVGLDRSYPLAPADCASGDRLVALAVDRWLTAFPEWAEPPRPPPAAPVRWTEVVAAAAVNSLWLPIGIEGEAAAIVDRGGASDRFGGTLRIRATVPQAAGSGHFQQTAFLAGATWRHRIGRWETRAELRGGRVLVIGMGFRENDHDWLWWWEAAGFAGRRFGWGSAGLEVAATALRDHAVTRDGLVSQDIPLLRVGIAGTFDVAK